MNTNKDKSAAKLRTSAAALLIVSSKEWMDFQLRIILNNRTSLRDRNTDKTLLPLFPLAATLDTMSSTADAIAINPSKKVDGILGNVFVTDLLV